MRYLIDYREWLAERYPFEMLICKMAQAAV